MDDVDKLLVNLWIMDARQLTTHQLRRIDRNIIGKDAPGLLGPYFDCLHRQFALVQIHIEWMMQPGMIALYFFDQNLTEVFRRQRPSTHYGVSRHAFTSIDRYGPLGITAIAENSRCLCANSGAAANIKSLRQLFLSLSSGYRTPICWRSTPLRPDCHPRLRT